MTWEVRTIVNGRRLFVRVGYKRNIKRIMDDWQILWGDQFTYVDIRPVFQEEKVKVKVKKPVEIKETIKEAKVINWPKVKTWLEKYGT